MAKTGFWLKGAKGKLAGTTIYQQNGETVMREIVSPSNPKTNAQLVQRIIMHTVMGSYSLMKEIVDHSFEGVKKGQDTMSYFMKQNVQFCREKIATMQQQGSTAYEMYNFAPLGVKGFTPNQYQVAMGSLPRIDCNIVNDESQLGYLSGFSANTYADVIATLGLRRGDQLTFCLVSAYGSGYGQCEFHFCRVILDPTNADGTPADLSSAFIGANGKINLPSVRNEGNFYFAFNAANQITFGIANQVGGFSAFVIASRKGSDNNWLRSTTYMAYIEGANSTYNLGECLDMAKNGATSLYTANSLYLNNAGSSVGNTPAIDPTPTPGAASILGVTVRGSQAISGTPKVVEFANGTTFPQNVQVVVSAENANGKALAILDGTAVKAEGSIANGTCTLTVPAEKNKTYVLHWSEEEEFTPTAYSFSVIENSAQGGGGNEDIGDGD